MNKSRYSKKVPAATPSRRKLIKAAVSLPVAASQGQIYAKEVGSATAQANAMVATVRPVKTKLVTWTNWSGLQTARPSQLLVPSDESELQSLISRAAGEVRATGSGHSFTALVPSSGTIISLEKIAGLVSVDKERMTATVKAGTRLGALSRALDAQGLALRNLPDIDVQTLAGAVATGTHGTGISLPPLHADIIGMRLVTAQGEILDIDRQKDKDLLAAARVSLGALGIFTQFTIQVVPAFKLHRRVWMLSLEELFSQAPKLMSKHRHFEVYILPFTGYAAAISHDIYTGEETKISHSADEEVLKDLKKLRDWLQHFPKLRTWVAQKLLDPNLVEESKHKSFQLLTSLRSTKFNESEWHIPVESAFTCLKRVIDRLEKNNEVFFPMEVRFTKGDDAWLSPFHHRDSCSIALHSAASESWSYLVSDFREIFSEYSGRPHWGKLHDLSAKNLSTLYPKWNDFEVIRKRMDSRGKMLNAHLKQIFGVMA